MHPDWNKVVEKLRERQRFHRDLADNYSDPLMRHQHATTAAILEGLAEALNAGLYPEKKEG